MEMQEPSGLCGSPAAGQDVLHGGWGGMWTAQHSTFGWVSPSRKEEAEEGVPCCSLCIAPGANPWNETCLGDLMGTLHETSLQLPFRPLEHTHTRPNSQEQRQVGVLAGAWHVSLSEAAGLQQWQHILHKVQLNICFITAQQIIHKGSRI